MKVYRIENPETHHGMWYQADGTYDPFIKTLSEGISKGLPMEYNAKHNKDGFKWFSGCKSLRQLTMWFSNKDIEELLYSGYRLYELECSQYMEEVNEVLFTREGIEKRTELGLYSMAQTFYWVLGSDGSKIGL